MKISAFLILPLGVLLSNVLFSQDSPPPAWSFASGDNCTFKADPNAFLQQNARAIRALHQRMASFDKQRPAIASIRRRTP